MPKCSGHPGTLFSDEHLKESIRQGSTYAASILYARHPELGKGKDEDDVEIQADAKRVMRFYKSLLATATVKDNGQGLGE